uniref:CATR tumorigenic conversion 1 protein n=1 Tax=Homo sapiens TaxID=9606 RepID=CATR1_HUMAN|nr:RecName: Full=CATR tumorigenic conversion 1 protein; AltName: Full=CATR1.3 [Homo sapiens]prf//2116427A CATR1.3 gene [Homo sapiens]
MVLNEEIPRHLLLTQNNDIIPKHHILILPAVDSYQKSVNDLRALTFSKFQELKHAHELRNLCVSQSRFLAIMWFGTNTN